MDDTAPARLVGPAVLPLALVRVLEPIPLEHFDRKWALDEDERRVVQIEWRTDYRHEVLRLPVATKCLRRLFGWHLGGLAGRYIVVRAENAVTNLVASDARASGSRGERTAS